MVIEVLSLRPCDLADLLAFEVSVMEKDNLVEFVVRPTGRTITQNPNIHVICSRNPHDSKYKYTYLWTLDYERNKADHGQEGLG